MRANHPVNITGHDAPSISGGPLHERSAELAYCGPSQEAFPGGPNGQERVAVKQAPQRGGGRRAAGPARPP
eukprot:11184748-Lingulodinium_polyedra.AAC.1